MFTFNFRLDFSQSSRAYKFYYHVKKDYLRHLEFYLKEGIADIVKNATLGHAFCVCDVRTMQTGLPVSAHILYSKKISVSESKS